MVHKNRYLARKENGVYSDLTDKIEKLGDKSLGGADYNQHFTRTLTPQGHYKYIAMNNDEEGDCHFVMFGQVCPLSMGTQLSSRGNKTNFGVNFFPTKSNTSLTFSEFQGEPIDDKTSVKHVIVVGPPTHCDESTSIVYDNQIVTLQDIRNADHAKEQAQDKVCRKSKYASLSTHPGQNPIVKTWFRWETSDSTNTPTLIALMTDFIYGVRPTFHKCYMTLITTSA